MEQLKYAQDLIKANTNVMCGFNTFINGGNDPSRKHSEYGDRSEWYSRVRGYEYAKRMARNGDIAFKHPFKCDKSDSCYPFEYGGFFVCNSCGNKSVDKEWWKIKVELDGNKYHCHGLDFVNLMESENHAFGDTFEEAIKNYEKKMLSQLN